MKKLIILIGVVIAAVIAILVINPFTVVEAGERGVVLTWGAYTGQTFDPGLHVLIPIAQSIVKMNVRTEKLQIDESAAYSHDLQNVKITSVVNYNLDPAKVGEIYQQYGHNYEEKILYPNLEAAVKQTVAKYSAEEILSKRGEVQSQIETTFRQSIPEAFTITKYALVNETFSDIYEAAIEAKQVAQQNAEKAENELKRAKIDAESRVAQAQAEAEAIRLQSEAASNDKYVNLKALDIQLEAIKKWDGHLPAQMIPGSALPFINLTK